MPFIRQSRDKRGFEHTYVMHVSRSGGGAPRTRVLYVFRSPGNLKVGRKALDAEVMEALEHTHPDLSFDWQALTREAVVTRTEPQAPRPRGQRPGTSSRPAAAERAPEDESLLGRTVGAAEAARIRRRHADLLQRIVRRSRTPEERDRLSERAGRLNPDGWTDEATVREQAPRFDAACDGIAGELPTRRRGRRGGRRRQETGAPGPSGIMAEGGESHEETEQIAAAPAGASGPLDTGRHDDDVGPADPETGIPDGD